jgi:cold shock CspA family protein
MGEEITMPKSKKGFPKIEPGDNTQKLYARAYALRLAKQVGEEQKVSRGTTKPRKKPRAKR